MSSSESDSDSAWNEQLLSAVSMKRGTGPIVSEQDRIEQMQKCLDQGADIDTLDKKDNTARNQKGYTAITLAEHLDRKEILDILGEPPSHENKQVTNQTRRSTENMLVDDARPSTSREGTLASPRTSPMRMSDDQCDESGLNKKRKPHSTDDEYNGTAKKLRIARDDSPQLARHSDVTDDTDFTGSISSRDPVLPRTVDRVIQSLPIAGKRTYNVSGLKRTFHGIAYQWKHLMLILHRARKEGYPFRLDTELDAAEKFDDVVLEYVDSKRGIVHRFMQIKHKQDGCKMITATDLKAKLKAKDNAFSIVKYFISWREIQKNPDFKMSTSKEFILCTNIGLDVTELNAKNIEVKPVVTDDLLKVTVDLKKKPLFYKLVNKSSSLRDKLKSEASASEVEISKFFEEFILAVNQPNEMELGKMINHEIRAYSQFNLQNMDFVWGSFQNRIVNWLKKSGSHNKFLEKADADAFFVAMERALSSLITVGLNLMYWSELKKYDIKFKRDNEELEKFIDSSSSNHIRILKLISSEQTLLTNLRVYQTLEDSGKYQKKDSFIFIQLEKLLLPDIMNDVLQAFESSHSHSLMVIDCGTISSVTEGEPNFWNRLREIVETNSGKKMILIIQRNNDPALQFEVGCQILYEKNSDISIDNLKECYRQTLLEKSIVKFQGHDERTNFGRLLGIRDCGDIESTKLSALRRIIDQQTLTQLIRGEEIPIGGEVRGLCEVEKYYIPRIITEHVVIEKSVLQDPKMPDLFAISGISLKSLEKLLASQEETYYFDESNATKFDPVKCSFLEKDRAEEHFKDICDQNPNRNIHWLQAESGKLLWKRSHGDITGLVVFEETVVHDDNAERPGVRYFAENQLMQHAKQRKIVIISDTAGMGKSTVLTHFAEKIKKNQPSSLVIKVDLTQHTSALHEQRQKRTFNASDTDYAVDFLVEKISCLDTELEREVFKEIIKVTGEAALLFDGFDEISPEYESIVIDLLKALSILRINRLIVTTRPHTNKRLEKKLATFAYHLQPFSPTNQTEFLIAFWKKGLNSSDDMETVEENLNEHASEVLKFLVASIDRRMEDFTGIPLLTRMVAEIFPYEEKRTQINLAESRKAYTIIDLYRLFVEKNIKVFCKEKQLGDDTNSAHRMHSKLVGKMIIIIHQKLALEALFPDETLRADLISCQPEKDKMFSFLKEEIEPVERIGIVTQVINKNPHFVHRTFAEYFAAQFLIDTLIDNRRNEVVRRFFVAEIFVQPQYKTIRAFLNCLLSDKDYASDDEKESWKFSLSKYFLGIRSETLYHVAVDENNHEIIRFFSHRLSKLDSLRQTGNIDLENYFTDTPLDRAIKFRKSDIVKLLVEKRADVNSIDKDGWTPLHNAIIIRDLNIVRYIVEAGACINSVNKYGQTPLHHAVPRDWNIMRYIVEAGADINSVDKDGLTPLHYAVKTKDLNIVRYIVEAGAGINSIDKDGLTPLHYAVKTKDLNVVRHTVEAGASINAVDKDGLAPLHYAVKIEDLNIVRYIVEAGAGINSIDKDGLTPLHYAVKTKNLNIMRYTVGAGASINAVDKDGSTSLHYAVKTEDLNTVRCIVEAGACLNSVDNYGWAPLHHAVVARDLNIVRYIVEAGAGINSVDEDGWTPLHYAVKTEDSNIVRCIVDAGAENNSVDKDGWTPLHYAVLTRDLNIVRYIVEKDADNHGTSDMVEITDSLENRPMVSSKAFQKSTPLHRTVEVKSLDAEGAVINSKSKRGLTPLHLAVISGRSDIVQYLLKESANVNSEADFRLTPRHIAVHFKDSSTVACLDEYGANFDPAADRRSTPRHLKLRGKFLATIMQYEDMINFRGAATRSLCSLRMLCYILKLDYAESFIYCSSYPEA